LPFHAEVGNQTSILISESLVGVSVAATRQNAGRSVNGFGPRPARPLGGGANDPGGTLCAEVIVACGSGRDARLSHVAATVVRAAPISSS